MIANLISTVIFVFACILMGLALLSFTVSIFSPKSREDCRSIFLMGLVCALVLWYLSWLVSF